MTAPVKNRRTEILRRDIKTAKESLAFLAAEGRRSDVASLGKHLRSLELELMEAERGLPTIIDVEGDDE
jgi:hypothetical protein